jgi:hypothetical protein
MHPVHPTMMAAIAADHIKDMRDDAVRDHRARTARRSRRAGQAAVRRQAASCELIEQHA